MSLIAHFFPMRHFLPNSAQTDGPCANEAGQVGNRASSSWMQDICSHAMFLCNDCIYSRIRFKNAPGGALCSRAICDPNCLSWSYGAGKQHHFWGAELLFLKISATEFSHQRTLDWATFLVWHDQNTAQLVNMSQDTAEQGDMSSMKEGSRQQVNRYFHRGQQIAHTAVSSTGHQPERGGKKHWAEPDQACCTP